MLYLKKRNKINIRVLDRWTVSVHKYYLHNKRRTRI
jgi:hypothetical protein